MESFENVTVEKKANIYYEGKVTSRTVRFADGSRKTLGIMLPGEYEFGTGAAEVIEILGGELAVLLPDAGNWQNFAAGDRFDAPADARFRLRVLTVVDYCCSYDEKA